MDTRRGTLVLVPLVLFGLAVLLFPGPLLRGEVFYDRDIHLEWFSQIEGFVRSLAASSWPVWDNSIGFGQPLLADPSAQVLYPPTWINLLVLPWTYYTIFVFLHLMIAGLGVFALARALGLERGEALLSAAVFVYSGPLVSLVNLWHHFASTAYVPWVVLGALEAARGEAKRGCFRLLLPLALQILAGSADVSAMSLLVVSAVLLAHADLRRPLQAGNLRMLGAVGVAVLVAAGLTAASWMTALEVVLASPRRALPEAMRTFWSVSPRASLQALVPILWKDPNLPRSALASWHDGANPLLASLYLGGPALALAAAASASVRRRLFLGLLGLGAGAFLVALGRHAPFYGLAVGLLPPFQTFRYPMKAMIFASLAVALLAGLGLQALRTGRPGARGRAAVFGATLGAAALGAGILAWRAPLLAARLAFGTEDALQAVREAALALGLAGLLGLVASALWLGAGRRVLLAAAALGVVADLGLAHRGLIPTTPRDLVVFKPPVVEALGPPDGRRLYVYEYFLTAGSARRYLGRDDAYPLAVTIRGVPFERAQVLAQRLYPFPPVAGRWGYEGSFDVDTRGLYPPEVSTLNRRVRAVEGTPALVRLLRLGAVSRVVALHGRGFEDLRPVASLPSLFPEEIRVFAVPDPLPRAYAVAGVRVAAGAFGLLESETFDPRGEVVLREGAPTPARPAGTVRVSQFRPDRVRLEADLDTPGHVVLVDAFAAGWEATLDGKPVPVLRANEAFRAVAAGAGRHEIEMVYRPRGFRWGLAVSGLVAVGLLLWIVRQLPWRRKPRTPVGE